MILLLLFDPEPGLILLTGITKDREMSGSKIIQLQAKRFEDLRFGDTPLKDMLIDFETSFLCYGSESIVVSNDRRSFSQVIPAKFLFKYLFNPECLEVALNLLYICSHADPPCRRMKNKR